MDKKLYKMMDWARIEGIVYSEDDNPHDFLGCHAQGSGTLIQCFLPGAKNVKAVLKTANDVINVKLAVADEEGFFAAYAKLPAKDIKSYYFIAEFGKNKECIVEDPYRFAPTIPEAELKKFNNGINYEIYKYLGAHVRTVDGITGTSFAVWAPSAVRISVVGDFNNWDGRIYQMRRLSDSGVFEIFIPGIKEGEVYKYELKLKGGNISLKADPYGFGNELRPGTASIVRSIDGFNWNDNEWLNNRKKIQAKDMPMSIYELHLGSFKKPEDDREFFNYKELAPMVAEYVKDMGYTHIEIMPVMEHPLDESWGYQVIGYYAPTSRYGTPKDFMYFMNYMHEEGIGVILDWVPAHFPRDIQGLSSFDGTCLYEHKDPRQGYHPHWGTLIFNYGRKEVSNYLIANALYWLKEYHADGIRIDAVASMLYLDYGRNDGEWIANIYGGNENLEAVELLKHLNSIHKQTDDGSIIIAEESTAWPMVTGDLNNNGLGFDYKWNMGWMNDFIEYLRYDPYFRSHHYGELTFSMIYAYSERFVLMFSHDEVVHGKASMIAKMPGERKDKFANLRAAYGYMLTHPGKIMTFMGQDIAEFDEWNEKRSVEWNLLQYDEHKQFNVYVKELLSFYKSHPALYKCDNQVEGFEWINNISANENIIVFLRKCEEENLLCVMNFSNIEYKNHKIGVPKSGKYKEIFNSDSLVYGGTGVVNPRVKASKEEECDDRNDSIKINVAPLSLSVFAYAGENTPVKRVQKKSSALKNKISEKYRTEEKHITL